VGKNIKLKNIKSSLFFFTDGDLTHACLDSNSLQTLPYQVKRSSGESGFIIGSTYCINKEILCKEIMLSTISVKRFFTVLPVINLAYSRPIFLTFT
jgi:hypothetical protein